MNTIREVRTITGTVIQVEMGGGSEPSRRELSSFDMLRPFTGKLSDQMRQAAEAERWGRRLVEQHVCAVMDLDEAEIRRMLSLWISGMEPELLQDPNGVLIGVSVAGHEGVIVLSSGDYQARRRALGWIES